MAFLAFSPYARAAALGTGVRLSVKTVPLRVQALNLSGVDPKKLAVDWASSSLGRDPLRLGPTKLAPAWTAEARALAQDGNPDGVQAPEGSGESGLKGMAQRVRALLSRIANPFGASAAPVSIETLASLDIGTPLEFTYRGERRGGVVLDVQAKTLLVAIDGKKSPLKLPVSKVSELRTLPGLEDLASLSAKHGLDLAKLKSRLAARRAYERFLRRDYWAETKAGLQAEIASLRRLGSKEAVAAYARKTGQEIVARVQEKHATANIGFHYNLHGGQAADYVAEGGIHATMGDIALNYSMHGDRAFKVYFFQSAKHQLYDVLDERNPNLFAPRMGHILNVFRLDSPVLQKALQDGTASHFNDISIDFDREKLDGIPYDAYLAPPLETFNGVSGKVGLRLSRNEETLAVMRYLEAALMDPESFIP